MKKLLILIIFFSYSLMAEVNYNKELTSSIGMNMVSFAENPKTIQGDNVGDPVGGSVAAIAASLQYNFMHDYKKNFYLTTSFPLLPGPQLYLGVGFGMEYYLNDIGAKTQLFTSGTSLSITPTFRYFVGGEIGVGYLVYTSETATKSDVLFELGGCAGIGYTISENWSLKSKLSVLKGTGIVTSAMNISAFLGMTRFID